MLHSGYSLLWCVGFSSQCLLLLWSTGFRGLWPSSCSALGFVALQHVGSSQTRDQTHVPCIGRLIVNHWTTRAVLQACFNWQSENHFCPFSLLQFDQKGLSNQQSNPRMEQATQKVVYSHLQGGVSGTEQSGSCKKGGNVNISQDLGL